MSKKAPNLSIQEKIRAELTKALSVSVEAAIAKALQAVDLCKKLGDIPMKLEVYQNLGEWYGKLGNDEQVGFYWNKSLSLDTSKLSYTELANLYKNYGVYWAHQKQVDKAIYWTQKAIDFATTIEEQQLLINCMANIGVYYTHDRQFALAKEQFDKAIQLLQKKNYKELEARIFLNLGIMLKLQKRYEEAIPALLKASNIQEQLGNKLIQASCFNTVANIYTNIRQRELALNYHQKALAINKQLNDTTGVLSSYNNIGEVWLMHEAYQKALACFTEAYHISKKLPSHLEQHAKIQSNLVRVYLKLNDYVNAKKYALASLAIRSKMNDSVAILTDYSQLGEIAFLEHDYDNAAMYLEKGRSMVPEDTPEYALLMNYNTSLQLYEAKGEFKLALNYCKRYSSLKDKLYNQKLSQQLTDLQVKYETKKKENENEWLQRQVSLEKENKEHIQFLLRELHHRVKNNLQELSSLLSLQANSLDDEYARNIIKNSEHRVVAMNMIHKELYLDGNSTTSIDIPIYIQNLTRYLLLSFGYSNADIELHFDIDKFDLIVDKVISLGLIVNEFVNNSFKHAFVDHPNPRLEIKLKCIKEQIVLYVKDNGLHPDVNLHEAKDNSFGLKLINILSRQLKGQLQLDYDNGMVGSITFSRS